jgi:hypothetical protein
MTTEPDRRRITPFKIGGGIIKELGQTYESPWSAYRELDANGVDLYVCSCKNGKHIEGGTFNCAAGKEHKVVIELDRKNRTITITDNATGIEDVNRFKQLFTDNVDGSDGKRLGNITSSYKNPDARMIGKKNIGRQGAGTLSKDGEVKFASNNGKNGHIFRMAVEDGNAIGWIQVGPNPDDVYEIVDTTAALPFRGLQVTITDVRPQYLDMKLLAEKLGEWFAIHLVRDSKETHKRLAVIEIKDYPSGKTIRVTKPEYILTDNEIMEDKYFKLPTSGEFVSHRIQHGTKKEGNHELDIRVNYVKICSYAVPYWIRKGSYINNNGVLSNCLNPGRERIQDSNPAYQEIFNEETGILAKFFKREKYDEIGAEDTEKKFKAKKTLEDLMSRAMDRYARLFPDAKPLIGTDLPKGSKGEPQEEGEKHETEKPTVIENVDIKPTEENTGITKKNKPTDEPPGPGGGPGGTNEPINYEITGEGPYTVTQKGGKPKDEEKKVKSKIILEAGRKGKNEKTFFMDAADHAWLNTDRDASVILLSATKGARQEALVLGYVARAIVSFEMKEKNSTLEASDDRYEKLLNSMVEEK